MITFSGGLILGLIIGALVVTALALYILWSPVRGLRDRCREAEQENERVRQANLDVMMHFEDMKAAKEQAEAIAESEILGFQTVAIEICRQEADEWDSDRLHTFKNYAEACGKRIGKLIPANARAQLLQLRAEAVEAFLLEQAPLLDRYRPGPINEQDHCCEFNLLRERERLHSEANRLRAKAEEQEKGGGDES